MNFFETFDGVNEGIEEDRNLILLKVEDLIANSMDNEDEEQLDFEIKTYKRYAKYLGVPTTEYDSLYVIVDSEREFDATDYSTKKLNISNKQAVANLYELEDITYIVEKIESNYANYIYFKNFDDAEKYYEIVLKHKKEEDERTYDYVEENVNTKEFNGRNVFEAFLNHRKSYMCEVSTSRLYTHITSDDNWAIVSPYRSEYSLQENKRRMTELKSIVRNDYKLGFVQFISRWVEDGESFDEESLLIPNLSKSAALKLGKKFEQSSVIVKDGDSCVEICTTPFETYNVGDIVRTYNISGKDVMNIKDAEDIFSRRKGGPASKPIKSNRPFHLSEVLEVEQPKASTFNSKYSTKTIYRY